ncbi:MAG: hypothetical protein ACYTF3_00510, partial [Planctomycetota bacterium]
QLALLAAFLPGLQLRWPLPPRGLPGILAPGLAAGLAAAAVQAWTATGWLAVDLGLAIAAGGAAAIAATWAFRRQDLRELLAALGRG